jgi:hypothetical protein
MPPPLTRCGAACPALLLLLLASACADAPPPPTPPPPTTSCRSTSAASSGADLQDIVLTAIASSDVYRATGCLVVPGVAEVQAASIVFGLLDRRGTLLGSGGQSPSGGPFLPPPGGGPVTLVIGAEPRPATFAAVTDRVLVSLQLDVCRDAGCRPAQRITHTLVRRATLVGVPPPR